MHYIYVSCTICWSDFNHDGDYVIRKVCCHITWCGYRTPDYWLRGLILKLAFWALPSAWILGKFVRSNIGPTFFSNFCTHCVSDLSAQRGSHWWAISSPATLPNDIWCFGATDRRKMGVFDQHKELSAKLGQIRPHRVSDIVSSTSSPSAQNIGPSLPNGEFRQHYYRTFD